MGMLLRRHKGADSDGQAEKGNEQGHETKKKSQSKGKKTKKQSKK